jgi:hypothetical protein
MEKVLNADQKARLRDIAAGKVPSDGKSKDQ